MEGRDLESVSSCCLNETEGNSLPSRLDAAGFVAINTIHCKAHYTERFECLFCSRAKMIDKMPGFLGMNVLKSQSEGEPYLVVSYWETESHFQAWVGSPEFHEGHKRAFEDLRKAKEAGEEPPMTSDFRTYSVLTR
ncbi:MAG: antibiotic biosynthesis monooxygenase [Fimbriimonadaceae bacterium]|jgi:heme-degrading monooxygenase HmoA|nr:antibiotic biosynthesis monooxygenase [Fimbriimonadaceae bacterium]